MLLSKSKYVYFSKYQIILKDIFRYVSIKGNRWITSKITITILMTEEPLFYFLKTVSYDFHKPSSNIGRYTLVFIGDVINSLIKLNTTMITK